MSKRVDLKNGIVNMPSNGLGISFGPRVVLTARRTLGAFLFLSTASMVSGQELSSTLIDKVANMAILSCQSSDGVPSAVAFLQDAERGLVALGLGPDAEVRTGDNGVVTVIVGADVVAFTDMKFSAITGGAVSEGTCVNVAGLTSDVLGAISSDKAGKGAMEAKIAELEVKIAELEGKIASLEEEAGLTVEARQERDHYIDLKSENLELRSDLDNLKNHFTSVFATLEETKRELALAQKSQPPAFCQESIEAFLKTFSEIFSGVDDISKSGKVNLERGLNDIRSKCLLDQ